MRYREYWLNIDNLEKRLGVLGEVHFYSKEESDFAKRIVTAYDNIAIEGSNKITSMKLIGLLYAPMFLTYVLSTKRIYPTALNIAKKQKKNIIYLEQDINKLFTLEQKLAIGTIGAFTIPLLPMFYVYLKIEGDPFKGNKRPKYKRNNLLNIINFASNLEKRDKIMAERCAYTLTNKIDNLLVVCGDGHLDGIVKNLSKKLKLKEIVTN